MFLSSNSLSMKYTLLFLSLFVCHFGFGQNTWLYIENPQAVWRDGLANIDEARITLEPKGIYTELGLYLTFSEADDTFNPGDSLEIVLDFQLPDESLITDSWLWIDELVVKADIIDRWTATEIYNEIVGRRQDPSILFKQYDNTYQLRIFPLAHGESRKVKLTFLVRNDWTSQELLTAIPLNILNASTQPVSQLDLRVYLKPPFTNPRILNHPNLVFSDVQSDGTGTFKEASLSSEQIQSDLQVGYETNLPKGAYVNYFPEDKVYEMVFFPKESFQLESGISKKVLIIADYNSQNSSLTTIDDLLDNIYQQVLTTLNPSDYFNLIIADLTPMVMSPNWLPATPESVESIRQPLEDQEIATYLYNNLRPALVEGIQFIQENDNQGEIILLSNSQEEGDPPLADEIINDFIALMPQKVIPIHVVDFQDDNFNYFYTNINSYAGNEYFFTNLAQKTAGNYSNLHDCCPDLYDISADIFAGVKALKGRIDVHTTLDKGFCYDQYDFGFNTSEVNFNEPIYQIGKYEGEFPFIIDAAGILNDSILATEIEVGAENVIEGDHSLTQAWTGKRIDELELRNAYRRWSGPETSEIINLSIQERVLSIYTAFLALEPSRGGEVCQECNDPFEEDGTTVSLDDEPIDSLVLTAYPNPFTEFVNITIENPDLIDTQDLQMAIYNLNGQMVKTYNTSGLGQSDAWNLEWNATDDQGQQLAGGIYYFVVQTQNSRQNLKLTYLK